MLFAIIESDQLGVYLGAAVSIVSLCGTVAYLAVRIARIELKANTVWDFIMRRALSEALEHGLLTKNSPLVVTKLAEDVFAAIKPDLIVWYNREGSRLGERDLFEAVERTFGERLTNEICVKLGLDKGGCVTTAIEIMKKSTQSDTKH
jgi:hypothetical protein